MIINELFELRGTADYGGTEHVNLKSAHEALGQAKKFVQAIKPNALQVQR